MKCAPLSTQLSPGLHDDVHVESAACDVRVVPQLLSLACMQCTVRTCCLFSLGVVTNARCYQSPNSIIMSFRGAPARAFGGTGHPATQLRNAVPRGTRFNCTGAGGSLPTSFASSMGAGSPRALSLQCLASTGKSSPVVAPPTINLQSFGKAILSLVDEHAGPLPEVILRLKKVLPANQRFEHLAAGQKLSNAVRKAYLRPEQVSVQPFLPYLCLARLVDTWPPLPAAGNLNSPCNAHASVSSYC